MKDGELTVTGSGGGDIMTEENFAAFELQLDFQLTPGANSGIKYFTADNGKGETVGLEYQLLDDERHADAKQGKDGNRTLASLYDIQPRGALMTNVGIAPKVGEWQHARIVARADGNSRTLAQRREGAELSARVRRFSHVAWPRASSRASRNSPQWSAAASCCRITATKSISAASRSERFEGPS